MPEENLSLEARVERLEQQVGELMAALDHARVEAPKRPETDMPSRPTGVREDASEEILTWVGKSSLLPRLSTLCFLLVVALGLRTVTDNNMIDTQVGSLLGMVYAGALMFAGSFQYQRSSPLAPVLTLCGAFLMFSIIMETHARFASLPSSAAYVMVIATGVGLGFVSHVNRVALPILVGAFGMCFAGISIDYPNPSYSALAILLLAANLLGFWASRLKRCSWLRWTLWTATMVMVTAWGIKLGGAISRREMFAKALAIDWFLPMAGLLGLFFLLSSIYGILRPTEKGVTRFDLISPALSAAWIFMITAYVVNIRWGTMAPIGMVGTALALLHFALALWLGRRPAYGKPGTNSYLWAGATLLGLAMPAISGELLLSLVVLSAMAFGFALLAKRWVSGGIRITSYLLQIYCCVGLIATLFGHEKDVSPLRAGVAAAALSLAGLFHYRWCRKNAPQGGTAFARLDDQDRTAILLLMAALINAFALTRVVLYQGLLEMGQAGGFGFSCGQTVVINVSATLLMMGAFARRNKELRNVAILVIFIGAIKVFFFDLVAAKGVPLVASVFSFGVAAALVSIALSRWQRMEAGEKTQEGKRTALEGDGPSQASAEGRS